MRARRPARVVSRKRRVRVASDQVRIGAFARARFRRGERVELEAPDEVVGKHAELLPGTVGSVVAGRDGIERELALELGQGLLLGAPATDEAYRAGRSRARLVAAAPYS
jgi:hypothetical protein